MSSAEELKKLFRDIVEDQEAADLGPGCAHCDADVTFTLDPADPLVLHTWIAHDGDCPVLRGESP